MVYFLFRLYRYFAAGVARNSEKSAKMAVGPAGPAVHPARLCDADRAVDVPVLAGLRAVAR